MLRRKTRTTVRLRSQQFFLLELCIRAESAWKKGYADERIAFMKRFCSNFRLSGVSLEFDLKKPFLKVLELKKTLIIQSGAQVPEVEEPLLIVKSILLELEVNEVVEPKILKSADLQLLLVKHGSCAKVAKAIQASESFVRQNSQFETFK